MEIEKNTFYIYIIQLMYTLCYNMHVENKTVKTIKRS